MMATKKVFLYLAPFQFGYSCNCHCCNLNKDFIRHFFQCRLGGFICGGWLYGALWSRLPQNSRSRSQQLHQISSLTAVCTISQIVVALGAIDIGTAVGAEAVVEKTLDYSILEVLISVVVLFIWGGLPSETASHRGSGR